MGVLEIGGNFLLCFPMSRNRIFIIAFLVVLSLGAGIAWRYRENIPTAPPTSEQLATSTPPGAMAALGPCLMEGEVATSTVSQPPPYVKTATISVIERGSQRELRSFEISDVFLNYHPLEIHSCGVYAIRMFNVDKNNLGNTFPGFSVELWRYSYEGKGEKLLIFATNAAVNYDYDFRVDNTDTYLQLITGLLGNSDYALVFRNLKTGMDDFILKLDDLLEQNPGIRPGSFDFADFNADRTYLWGDLYDGPFETAYFRIAFPSWKVEVFPPPPNIPSGAERTPRLRTGWVAYADITTFTGVQEITEQIWEEARKAGRQKILWLYNIFTKEQIKVASADPAWRFNIKWLSGIELEYFLPGGERKIYRVIVPKVPE